MPVWTVLRSVALWWGLCRQSFTLSSSLHTFGVFKRTGSHLTTVWLKIVYQPVFIVIERVLKWLSVSCRSFYSGARFLPYWLISECLGEITVSLRNPLNDRVPLSDDVEDDLCLLFLFFDVMSLLLYLTFVERQVQTRWWRRGWSNDQILDWFINFLSHCFCSKLCRKRYHSGILGRCCGNCSQRP